MLFERVAIVGVGLIGGSFALALKKAKACRHVVGVGRSAANLKVATERGVVDSIAPDAAAAARGADLVLLATPLAQFKTVFAQIGSSIGSGTLITWLGASSFMTLTNQHLSGDVTWLSRTRIRRPTPVRRVAS